MPGIPWGILYDYLKGKKKPSARFMDGSAKYVNENKKWPHSQEALKDNVWEPLSILFFHKCISSYLTGAVFFS